MLLQILSGGAIGGVLPTIAKLASTYVTIPSTPMPEAGLLVGIALFAFIGAGIAFATGQSDIRQALIAGIAAPGIITNLLAGATQPSPPPRTGVVAIVGSAYAQTPLAPAPSPEPSTRTIVIDPNVQGGLPSSTNIPVTAEITGADNKKKTLQIGTVNSLSGQTTVTLPATVDQLKIGGKPVDLDRTQSKIQLDVSTSPTSGSDFLWALGAQRRYQIDSISPVAK